MRSIVFLLLFTFSLGANLEYFFTDIYNKWSWGKENESVSGAGSNLEQTVIIRQKLPALLKRLCVKKIIDAPCGDFFWMRKVDLSFLDEYIGIDIVAPLIKKNKKRYECQRAIVYKNTDEVLYPYLLPCLEETYGNDLKPAVEIKSTSIKFLHADITKDLLPQADLVLCRDCFVHFTYETIYKTIKNFKKAGIKYLLTTTFTQRTVNYDLRYDSGWRVLNLQLRPFNFPDPIILINEGCTEDGGNYNDKSLGLWDLDSIQFN